MRRAFAVAMILVLPVLLFARPAAALSVLRTIPVGAQPFGVAAAGGLIYVTNNGGSTVSVIDTATNTVAGSVAVGNGPGEIVVDGGRAYVGNFTDGTVSVVDTATRSTVATLSPGGLGVAVDPVLHRLYATSGARLTVFDTDTLLAVAQLSAPAGGGWWAVAVDASRHRVYLGDWAAAGSRSWMAHRTWPSRRSRPGGRSASPSPSIRRPAVWSPRATRPRRRCGS